MIESVTKWLEDLFDKNSTKRLDSVFFRIVQIVNVISALLLITAIRPLYAVWMLGAILMAEVGLRSALKGNILGFWIGIVFSIQFLFGIYFFLGLFGLYALLNPRSQKNLLQDAPDWLRKILSDLHLNFIG